MQQRVQKFLSDLYFDITLFCLVLTPVMSMSWLVRDQTLDLQLQHGFGVIKAFGIMVYGTAAIIQAWTTQPADFATLCALPTFVWAMIALTFRTYLWLGWSWRWVCWGMMGFYYITLGVLGWLLVPEPYAQTACFAMGGFPLILTAMTALFLEFKRERKAMTYQLIAAIFIGNQVISPWLWLLFNQ